MKVFRQVGSAAYYGGVRMFATILIVSAMGLFYVARKQRITRLDNELRSDVNIKAYQTPGYYVGGIAAVSVYDAVHALSMIDDRVLQGLDFSTTADMTTFNQLNQYISEHFLSGTAEAVSGSTARLQGYVAEQVAAANLVAQGHVVEFPATSNNPGFDLIVDGHPLQVKDTLNPQLITEHFSKYPDIPVVTNVELAGHFTDNQNVLIDHNLSHDVIASKVENSIDGIHALGGASFHIPIITLALSGIRETGLLMKGNTDLGTVTKHVALDVAGVGGGGFFGKVAGAALVGAFAGPVGAVIGGIIGAIGGGILGRLFTNEIKMAAYNKALTKLNNKLDKMAQKLPEVIDVKVDLLHNKVRRIPRRFRVNIIDWIWPSRKWLLSNEITRRVLDTINDLTNQKNELLQTMHQQRIDGEISPAGIMAYNMVANGGYYYPEVKKDMNRITKAIDNLNDERKKLG